MTEEAEIDVVLEAVREMDRRAFSAVIRKRLADVEAAAGPEFEASAWEFRAGKPPRRMIILLTQTRNATAAERRAAIAKAVVELIDQRISGNFVQSGTQ
ncbi:MAG: hypothetical protein HY661_03760 [Betaproteobacteria bacterium]|nr:hypothetical protein [Betaproteobacteria bacterium]